ncbi:hypothetical protein PPTG_08172 [Phytophthora nicotianae INRA-310]|uniref:Uncharacterized protein n=1 Tax=Phytophthora nicotianae (strain INRA-310) TaxID=761204 RepID=W2QLA8_PHYN3|nr:hypothetical protein PPTG_08172 [Phytophthora nicotianae INRA-310]ETN13294.1 hypothetical protein PPTG_08172 [Phytophthora nicotianae INRA-310]
MMAESTPTTGPVIISGLGVGGIPVLQPPRPPSVPGTASPAVPQQHREVPVVSAPVPMANVSTGNVPLKLLGMNLGRAAELMFPLPLPRSSMEVNKTPPKMEGSFNLLPKPLVLSCAKCELRLPWR